MVLAATARGVPPALCATTVLPLRTGALDTASCAPLRALGAWATRTAAAKGKAAPAAKTRVAQAGNARSGAHVAVSKAPIRKGKTVVAHKAGGAPRPVAAKTKVAQP